MNEWMSMFFNCRLHYVQIEHVTVSVVGVMRISVTHPDRRQRGDCICWNYFFWR